MTRGRVVVLGTTGRNFAAGMSGGIAYVFDKERKFNRLCNTDMVDLESVTDSVEAAELRELIAMHQEATGSTHAANILSSWAESLPLFVKVFPQDYKSALAAASKQEQQQAANVVQKALQGTVAQKKQEPSVLDIENRGIDLSSLDL